MAAKIMFVLCCFFLITGIAGVIKSTVISVKTRKRQKQYTEVNQSNK